MAFFFESNAEELAKQIEYMIKNLEQPNGTMYKELDKAGQTISNNLASLFSGLKPDPMHMYAAGGVTSIDNAFTIPPIRPLVLAVRHRTLYGASDGWKMGITSLADLYSHIFLIERRFDHPSYTTQSLRDNAPYGTEFWWELYEYGVPFARSAYIADWSSAGKKGNLTLRYPIVARGKVYPIGTKFKAKEKKKNFPPISAKNYFLTVQQSILKTGGPISRAMSRAFKDLTKPV